MGSDMIRLGRHRLLCGDASTPEQMARLLGGEQVRLLICDPPWNVGLGSYSIRVASKGAHVMHPLSEAMSNDSLPPEEWERMIGDILSLSCSALIPGGAAYIIHSSRDAAWFDRAMSEREMHWSSTIIWSKGAVLTWKDYRSAYEPIWYGWRSGAPHMKVTDRSEQDVWRIPKSNAGRVHAAEKPVALMKRMILNSSREGDTVLDPCGGSGASLFACEETGRTCLMMEFDPGRCDAIVERFHDRYA